MATSGNSIPGARQGDKLNAGNINRWIAGANRDSNQLLASLFASRKGNAPGPNHAIPVVNNTSEDIPPGAPVSLEAPVDDSVDGLLNGLAFSVVPLEDATVSPAMGAVAVNVIPRGGAGTAYVSGMCLAQLTDDNSSLLAAAGITVVHDTEDSGNRFAVVRFGGAAAVTFREVEITGGKALGYGSLTGIKWTSTPIVTLSGTYDPATVGTATDNGVGWGTDLTTGELLLIVNSPVEDALGNYLSGGGAIDGDLPNTSCIRVMGSILIPDGSASEKTFWRAYEMKAS